MSILTPLDIDNLKATIQTFEHPSDAFRTFGCSECSGTVRINDTPDFEPEMDRYQVTAQCDKCSMRFFVVGISKDTESKRKDAMDDVMDFFMEVKYANEL